MHCPTRVYRSVWHSALDITFSRISPASGAPTTIVSFDSGFLGPHALV